MQVLLIGSTGFLGTTIINSLTAKMNLTIIGTSTRKSVDRLPLDLTQYDQVTTMIRKIKPNCIINCAALADVGECERNPELARRVNSLGPKMIADICSAENIKLIHISTDAVFDGQAGAYTEDSIPSPINVYAKTKLEGEEHIKAITKNYLILRTNFYGLNPRGSGLMNSVIQKLANNEKIIGISEIEFNPLWVKDLAFIILALVRSPYEGVLNCAGNEVFTKYEFIQNVAFELGYHDAKIVKGFSDEVFKDAKRPLKTQLNNSNMRRMLNIKIHNLHNVLSGSEFDEYRSKEVRKI